MSDDRALLVEASDPGTLPDRLQNLAEGDTFSTAVRAAALANPSLDVRTRAQLVGASDVSLSEAALDAVIARPQELLDAMWHEPRVIELAPLRLTETENGQHVIGDEAFEAFMRAWDSELAETVDFAGTDRRAIVGQFLAAEETSAQDEKDEDVQP